MTNLPPLLPQATRNLLFAALGLFLYMVVASVAAEGFRGIDIGGDAPSDMLPKLLGSLCGALPVILLAVLKPPDGGFSHWGGLIRTVSQTVLFFVGFAVVMMVLYPIVLRAVGIELPPQEQVAWLASDNAEGMALIAALVLICIVAPVVEEILFRGYLLRALYPRFGVVAALASTSILFGLMHYPPHYALPTAVLGLWFGIVALRSGGLVMPIVAHSVHNTIVVTILLLFPDTMDWIYER